MLQVWQHSVFWLALAATFPAFAEDALLSRPATCKPVLTIQTRGCQVNTVLHCAAPDAAPWRWEAYDDTGSTYVGSFDLDFVQIKTVFPGSGLRFDYDMTQSSSTAPAEVAQTGHGTERMKGEILLRDQRVNVLEYHDIARLDPPMLLDGTSLVRLRVSGTRTITPPLRAERQDFMNYYDPQTGILLGGESLLRDADGKMTLSGQPAQLIHPGEPGFDGTSPRFDCQTLSFNVTDKKAFHS